MTVWEAFTGAIHEEPARSERIMFAAFAMGHSFFMLLDLEIHRLDMTPLYYFEWVKFAAILFFWIRPSAEMFRHFGRARWFTESFKPLYWLSFCSIVFDFLTLLFWQHRRGHWG